MNQIYFVSSSGSNSNNGSNAAPWATVQYAIDTITSQAVVQNTDLFIKDGSYPEVVSLSPFSGPGTITLKAQTGPPLLQGVVQSGSAYSLYQISIKNSVGSAIVVNAGTLLIKDVKVSTSNSCIAVRGDGVVSTSGTLELDGITESVISCSDTGLLIYNSTLIGNGTFTGAFCLISGGKLTIFNSLSSNSFGGDRVNISGGVLTVKTPSSSPIDTLPGSSYGFATGGQIFNDTTQIFPADSTLNPPNASVINAGLITEGTLSNARLSPTVTTQGNIFNGLNQLVKTTADGKLPTIDGSLLTNITIPIPSASSIIAGTLSNNRLSSDVTLAGNIFNSASSLVKLTSLAKLPALDGSLLTNLPANTTTDASLLSSGTLDNARLTSLVTLAGNTFNTANNLVRTDVLNRLPAIDGSQLTNLPGGNSTDASSLVSGTLSDTRLSSNVTLQGNIFNAASKLIKTDSLNRLPAVDGSQLTNLPNTTDASLLSSGTLPDARLSSAVTIQGNTFNVANGLVKTDGSNRLPAIDGSLLTGLPSGTNASSLTTGTLPDARLSTNVTTQGNTFNGANQLLKVGSDGKLPSIDGSNLTNLPGGGGGTTNLSLANQTATTLDVLSSTGTDVTLPAATTTQAGLMSAADKVTLASGGGGASPIISSDLLIAKDYADNSSLPSSLILTAGNTSYSSSPQRRIVESGTTVKTNNFTLNRAATLLIRVTSNTPLVESQICLRKASDDSLLYWVGLQSDTNLVHYKNASSVLNSQSGAWTADKTYDIKIVIDPTHAYISTQLNSSSTPLITINAHSIALGADLYFSYLATGGQLLVDEMIAYKSSNKDISYTITPSAPLVQTIGNNTDTSFTITHDLNSKNVGTIIYETASPYELVTATVKYTTLNTVTIETGIVPTTNQFTVVAYPLTSYFEVPLKNSVNTYTKAQGVTPVALTYGATIPVDASLSNSFTVTLGGNGQFLNPTALINGFIYNYFITQDGTGSRIPTWDTSYSFGVAGIPTLSTAAGKLDWLSFIYIAGKLCFAGASLGF